MNGKLPIRICTGTLCYVMGGADLLLLEEFLTQELADKVDIKGISCLNCCNNNDSRRAPFVQVGKTIVDEATIPKVLDIVKLTLNSDTE